MGKLTVVLEEAALSTAVEAEAAKAGHSVNEVVVEALEQWLADVELDERERAAVDAARAEYKEKGGVEAHEFFRKLR